MRVGLGQFDDASDEQLSFVKQCGVDDFLLNTPKLPGKERWEFQDLLQLRTRAENAVIICSILHDTRPPLFDLHLAHS